MPRRKSFLDDLLTLPWWLNLILAAIVYGGLKYFVPTIEFKSPVFKGLATALPNQAGIFAGIFVFTAAISAFHAWRKGELLDRQTIARSRNPLPDHQPGLPNWRSEMNRLYTGPGDCVTFGIRL